MNNLIVKQVDFMGDELMAVKDNASGKVYVGVSYICRGLGLGDNQKRRQVNNVQDDIILNKGCVKFDTGVFDPNNETLGIEIDYLPLWLAKISITPKMKRDNPAVVGKLIDYQLKAKDVLAKAFVYGEMDLPVNYKDALKQLIVSIEANERLETKVQELLPQAELAERITSTKDTLSMLQASKILKVCGRNKLFCILRESGILLNSNAYSKNLPKQTYIDSGYFKVVVKPTWINNRLVDIPTTLVTARGIKFLHKVLHKKALLSA